MLMCNSGRLWYCGFCRDIDPLLILGQKNYVKDCQPLCLIVTCFNFQKHFLFIKHHFSFKTCFLLQAWTFPGDSFASTGSCERTRSISKCKHGAEVTIIELQLVDVLLFGCCPFSTSEALLLTEQRQQNSGSIIGVVWGLLSFWVPVWEQRLDVREHL